MPASSGMETGEFIINILFQETKEISYASYDLSRHCLSKKKFNLHSSVMNTCSELYLGLKTLSWGVAQKFLIGVLQFLILREPTQQI